LIELLLLCRYTEVMKVRSMTAKKWGSASVQAVWQQIFAAGTVCRQMTDGWFLRRFVYLRDYLAEK